MFGEGVNPRLRKLRDGLKELGLDADELLRHGRPRIVYGAGIYLLPRLDGTIVVGATAERVGFDKSLTASAMAWLLSTAPVLCPSLADAAFERAWTGLRPGSPDELPIIGAAPGWENVTLATGHYRNGIMLAPITAQLIANLLLRGQDSALLEHVSPERFQTD